MYKFTKLFKILFPISLIGASIPVALSTSCGNNDTVNYTYTVNPLTVNLSASSQQRQDVTVTFEKQIPDGKIGGCTNIIPSDDTIKYNVTIGAYAYTSIQFKIGFDVVSSASP
jgi:hypothetical protein